MSDELRAAAERLATNHDRRYWRQTGGDDLFPYDPAIDGPKVARAYLAERPADSELPVTEEWLRAVGFRPGQLPHLFLVEDGGEGGEIAVEVILPEEGMEESDSLFVCGELVHTDPTRGHVRRLTAALGIALKDST